MSQEEDLLFQRFEPWITSINSGEGLLGCKWVNPLQLGGFLLGGEQFVLDIFLWYVNHDWC